MKIKYTGSASLRRIGVYMWSKENGFVQDVEDAELAANLLTYPRPEFEAVDETSKEVNSFIEGENESALPKNQETEKRSVKHVRR